MTKTTEEVRDDVIHRICRLVDARNALTLALNEVDNAGGYTAEGWYGWHDQEAKTEGFKVAHYIIEQEQFKISEALYAAALQAAFLVARDVIAPHAEESDVAVVALTGNSYMPPIRDISDVEVIYQADDVGDIFEVFYEALENKLDELGIIMGSPDYDNMLYVIDSRRWRIKDDREVETFDEPNAWLDNEHYESCA